MKENEKKWKAVSIGGVTGIMIGASASFAATQQLKEEAFPDEPGQEEPLVETEAKSVESNQEETEVVPQTSSIESMSFGEAFAAARKELGMGGVFEWNGNKYTTYTEDEWAQLKEQDQEQLIESANDVKANEPDLNESSSDEPIEGGILANEPNPNGSALGDPIEEPITADNDEPISDGELVDNPEVRFLGENPEEIIDSGVLVGTPNDDETLAEVLNDDETLAEVLNDGEILVEVPNDGETYEVYASVDTEEYLSETSSLIQDSLHTLADENNNIPTSDSIEDVVMNDDDTMIDIGSDIDNAIIV